MAARTRLSARGIMARRKGRQAAASAPMRFLGRAGFLARGIMYLVIGWIALLVAFGKTGQQADKTGALHELSATPVGVVALWVLVVGFLGMAIWRLSEAAFGASGAGRPKAATRLASLSTAVLYAVVAWGVLEYAIGIGSPPSSDKQSVDLTATVMRHPGGRIAVIVIGLAFIGGGLYVGYQAWRTRFAGDLLLAEMGKRTRRIVEWLGRVGGVARGIVFLTAGVFLVVAAAEAKPGQAKGVDSALRTLAQTPGGPWLLVIVAIGLVMFGLFSCSEVRWRRV